jgi:hypothetical protein
VRSRSAMVTRLRQHYQLDDDGVPEWSEAWRQAVNRNGTHNGGAPETGRHASADRGGMSGPRRAAGRS